MALHNFYAPIAHAQHREIASQEVARQFHVDEDNVGDALIAFAEQAELGLLFPYEYANETEINSVIGKYSVSEALSLLLRDTNFSGDLEGGEILVVSFDKLKRSNREDDMQSGKIKRGFLASVSAIISGIGAQGTSFAQEASNTPDYSDIVVVTGSRLVRTGAQTPSPTTIIGAEAIGLAGDVQAVDLLNELPAIRATQTTGNVNTSDRAQEAGTSLLNLRGLGIDRTLVLVNGRRHVGSRAGSAAVDVNTIPIGLIERFEVVTGGASAVYGADAVSGVVNIITKSDFEGFSANAQFGLADVGDGERFQIDALAGKNFAQGRGNIYGNISYRESSQARASNRDYASRNSRFAPNPADTGSGDGIADQILFDNTGFIGTPAAGQAVGPNGELFVEEGGPFTFDANGNITPQEQGLLVLPFLSQGGDFVDLSGFDLVSVPTQALTFAGGARYELSENIEWFGDIKYTRAKAETSGQPTFNLGFDASGSGIPGAFLSAENPFVPQALRTILDDSGLDGFFVGRTNVDQGGRQSESERDTLQLYTGFKGNITDSINFSAHYQYGKTDNTTRFINERINSRFLQQIDVISGPNGPVCRDPSNGCVPLNILGANAATAEAIAFSHVDFDTTSELTQEVFNAYISGATGVEFYNEPVNFVLGAEYREESSQSIEGAFRNTGALFATAPIDDLSGSFDVLEFFGELSIPLYRGGPGAREINLEGAVRYADYSTIGDATTWKVGADWVIVDGLRVRGSVSQAVRAPNIGELFASVSQSNQFISDPCDADFINNGSAFRAANCAALGLSADFQSNSEAFTRAVFSGGNTGLDAETADTYTVGVVYQPSFIEGLSLIVDYWNISIDDAINSFPAQAVANGCVDASTINNPLCSAIVRDTGSGNITSVSSQLINIASFEASGIDFEVGYAFDLPSDYGAIDLGLTGTYLDKLDFIAQDGEAPDREAGELGNPELQFNLRGTYRKGNFAFTLEERFFSDTDFDLGEPAQARSPNSTGTVFYTDIQASYRLAEKWNAYVGVNNLFDKEPPALALVPETRAFGDDAIIYDQLGRYVYFGVRFGL